MVSSVPATRKHKLVMLSIVIFDCAMSEADLKGCFHVVGLPEVLIYVAAAQLARHISVSGS